MKPLSFARQRSTVLPSFSLLQCDMQVAQISTSSAARIAPYCRPNRLCASSLNCEAFSHEPVVILPPPLLVEANTYNKWFGLSRGGGAEHIRRLAY
jgi:hypothetical protein